MGRVIEFAFCQKMTPSITSAPRIGPKMKKIEENSSFGKCESENHHETNKSKCICVKSNHREGH